jgi:type I restriction enzyme S subunit
VSKLPKGWSKTSLDKFTFINMGQSPKGEFVNDSGSGLPFYQGKTEFGKLYPTPRKYCSKPTKLAEKDDILLSVRAPVGPTNLCPEKSCIGRGLASIRAVESSSQQYLLHYLRYLELWLSQQGTGTTFKAITGKFLREIDVLVAPLNEQTRIADKLDSMLAKVDAAQARLDNIPNILKRFRQSVLAAATSGELTKEWRGNNDFGPLTKIGDLTKDIKYGTSKKCGYESEKTPVLRIPNIGNGTINLSDLKYAEFDEKEFDKLKLKKDDILVIRSNGSVELVGKAAIIEDKDTHCLYAGYLIRIRFNTDVVASKYIMYALQSPAIRSVIEVNSRSTSGINNINSKELASLNFLLPEYKEQREIVRRVESLFTMADTVEKQYLDAKARTNRLTQSILAKAFRGELVPQDENDEPAGELIKRITEMQMKLKKVTVKKLKPRR